MENISNAIARWLWQEGIILDDEQEMFSYAAFCLLFGLLPVLIAIVLGIITGMVSESLLLILPFIILRKFSGGFHVQSAIVCLVLSALLIFAAIGLTRLIIDSNQTTALSILVLISLVSICVFSPIDSQSKKISPKEKIVFKWTARCLTSAVVLIFFILMLLNQKKTCIPIGVGVLITAALQWPCVIRNCRHHAFHCGFPHTQNSGNRPKMDL